jgi:hypothetical protein
MQAAGRNLSLLNSIGFTCMDYCQQGIEKKGENCLVAFHIKG